MNEGTAASKPMTSRAARRAASQARILDAARQEFGDRGFEATTVRGVARRAGVDPSLVLQHYGSKSALFTAAIQLPPASRKKPQTTWLTSSRCAPPHYPPRCGPWSGPC
jgi:hypothetical protein